MNIFSLQIDPFDDIKFIFATFAWYFIPFYNV